MKHLFALLVLLWSTMPLTAEVISLRRGLPTDIWLTWPDAAALDDPGLIEVFPEYRREYRGHEFHAAKAAGFDFIRLTIDPAVFLYNRRPEKTARLLAGMALAIAGIRAAGLKVVVDLHSIPRAGASPGTDQIMASAPLFAAYLEVAGEVGGALAGLPADEVAFEPMNEPTADCPWAMQDGAQARWPGMLKRLHAVARSAAPDLTLILSGGCWGGAEGLVALDPAAIADSNVIWSFHNYEPFVFTHQGAVWDEGHVRHITGLRFPPEPAQQARVMSAARAALRAAGLAPQRRDQLLAESEKDLTAYFTPGWAQDRARAPFHMVEAWAARHGIPAARILMGEFGATREPQFTAARQQERAGFYGLLIAEAEARGYGWSTWSWSGGMGISTTDTSRVLDPVMLRAMGMLQ